MANWGRERGREKREKERKINKLKEK